MEKENLEGGTLNATVERLAAAAEMLERAAEQLTAGQSVYREELESTVARIVATAERSEEMQSLESRLQAAVAEIAELKAAAAERETTTPARKTISVAASALMAKHGIAECGEMDMKAIDAALGCLSIEQRIAVKSELMRAGR